MFVRTNVHGNDNNFITTIALSNAILITIHMFSLSLFSVLKAMRLEQFLNILKTFQVCRNERLLESKNLLKPFQTSTV